MHSSCRVTQSPKCPNSDAMHCRLKLLEFYPAQGNPLFPRKLVLSLSDAISSLLSFSRPFRIPIQIDAVSASDDNETRKRRVSEGGGMGQQAEGGICRVCECGSRQAGRQAGRQRQMRASLPFDRSIDLWSDWAPENRRAMPRAPSSAQQGERSLSPGPRPVLPKLLDMLHEIFSS